MLREALHVRKDKSIRIKYQNKNDLDILNYYMNFHVE